MFLSHKLPVRHVFSADDAPERVGEDVVVVAVGVSPLKFFEVAVHVLLAYLVERADDRTLEQRPDAFVAVRVNIPAYRPFLDRVVGALMPRIVVCDPDV